jgi:surface antigen
MRDYMRLGSLGALVLVGGVLAGCQQDAGPRENIGGIGGALIGAGVGSQFGGGTSGHLLGAAIGAVAGGLVGSSIGRDLDDQERRNAQEAEYSALENGRPGSPVEWRGDRDNYYGEVTPGPRYRVNAYDCRDYTHKIWIDGQPQVARGTACRQPDGTWKPVN